MQLLFEYIVSNYSDYIHIYTDGWKNEHSTNSAFYINRFTIKQVIKLNDYSLVFSAELFAI